MASQHAQLTRGPMGPRQGMPGMQMGSGMMAYRPAPVLGPGLAGGVAVGPMHTAAAAPGTTGSGALDQLRKQAGVQLCYLQLLTAALAQKRGCLLTTPNQNLPCACCATLITDKMIQEQENTKSQLEHYVRIL